MPALKPQTRFLLRGSALLVGLLALWWFVLLGPMLSVLKDAAGGFLLIAENPDGNWTVRVPLEHTLAATPERPAQQIHSVDFDIRRSDVVSFTFSLPVFWAIILAAPGVRRCLWPLLLGTGLMCAVELVLLVIFAHITARNAVSQLEGAPDAAGKWARHVGEYLIISVLPFVVPVVVALSLHRELRGQVLSAGIANKQA